jgi:hypothetical protein
MYLPNQNKGFFFNYNRISITELLKKTMLFFINCDCLFLFYNETTLKPQYQ